MTVKISLLLCLVEKKLQQICRGGFGFLCHVCESCMLASNISCCHKILLSQRETFLFQEIKKRKNIQCRVLHAEHTNLHSEGLCSNNSQNICFLESGLKCVRSVPVYCSCMQCQVSENVFSSFYHHTQALFLICLASAKRSRVRIQPQCSAADQEPE